MPLVLQELLDAFTDCAVSARCRRDPLGRLADFRGGIGDRNWKADAGQYWQVGQVITDGSCFAVGDLKSTKEFLECLVLVTTSLEDMLDAQFRSPMRDSR